MFNFKTNKLNKIIHLVFTASSFAPIIFAIIRIISIFQLACNKIHADSS